MMWTISSVGATVVHVPCLSICAVLRCDATVYFTTLSTKHVHVHMYTFYYSIYQGFLMEYIPEVVQV